MRIPPWILEDVTEEWALRFYDMQDTTVQDVVRGKCSYDLLYNWS